MSTRFDKLITHIFAVEGEIYTNRRNDRGGPTKYGITLSTLRNYRQDDNLQAIDVENLTPGEAKQVYYKLFYVPVGGDEIISDRVSATMFDVCVNSGDHTAVKIAQKIVNCVIDGEIGPKTIKAINACAESIFVREFIQAQQIRYVDIVIAHPEQIENFRGWINRTHILWDMVS